MTAGTVIATLEGTGLRPGVSRNRRHYPAAVIARAVERAQARLADPDGRPITMRVAHPHPDEQAYVPVTEITGAVTGMSVTADGSMRFSADLHGTRAGQDVLKLVDNRSGQRPALRNVSIRGRWVGPVRTDLVDGQQCETADDLEIDGIDFTHLPGVEGAAIDRVAGPGGPAEAAGGAAVIYESCEETTVTVTETAVEAVPYADLGYLADGQRRWPLGTVGEARTAWLALHESTTTRQYTAAQLKRARARTEKALRTHGFEPRRDIGETVLASQGPVTEGVDFVMPGSFRVMLDNGMVCVSVVSHCVEPHDLNRLGTAAMAGAVQALAAMDIDADMPTEAANATGGPASATTPGEDEDEEPAEAADEPAVTPATETPASTEDAVTTTESEAPVMTDAHQTAAEDTTAATPSAPAPIALTQEALTQIVTAAATTAAQAVAEALRPASPTPAPAAEPVGSAPTTESAPADTPVTETEDQRIQRLVDARVTEALQTRVATGQVAPVRKGLVGRVAESGELTPVGEPGDGDGLNSHGLPRSWAGDKAPHELKGSERSGLSAALMQHVIGHRI